jgi:phosphoglucosamine mutase
MGAGEDATAARGLFGTDGIRGLANAEPVTCETALRLGRALAGWSAPRAGAPRRIVVGRDTRRSGDMLESAVCAGICSGGADALRVGVLPTPAVALLTRQLQAAAGVVISASHNPFADNGLKVFDPTGFKLPDEAEHRIEEAMCRDGGARPTAAGVGVSAEVPDAAARYVEFLTSTLPAGVNLKGLRVVIDCAHGAGFRVGPQALAACGAAVTAIGASPDGMNINHDRGALHPQGLQARVLAEGAALGLALDGDGDRLLCVDERGDLVDGDQLLAMAADEMLARGTLRQHTVVATVMSNLGLERALSERGARLVRVQVGDRYVAEEMRRHGYNLGGEQSGHLLFLDHSTTGDGLVAGLIVAGLMVQRRRPLSELARVMVKFPQVALTVRGVEHRDLEAVAPVRQAVERIRAALAGCGRVVVRCSGTEPVVRVMVEGEEPDRVRAYAEEIAAAIRAHAG